MPALARTENKGNNPAAPLGGVGAGIRKAVGQFVLNEREND
jgi:hypothetical protein